jgi:hypothetical protein
LSPFKNWWIGVEDVIVPGSLFSLSNRTHLPPGKWRSAEQNEVNFPTITFKNPGCLLPALKRRKKKNESS